MSSEPEKTETPVVYPSDLRIVLVALEETRALASGPEATVKLLKSLESSLTPSEPLFDVQTFISQIDAR